MDRESQHQLHRIVVWTALITLAHFALGTRTHLLHGGHILLGSLYLFPILIAAIGFGLAGGVLSALLVMGTYTAHLAISWANQPMTNPDQYAMLGAYLFVGVSAGALVKQANRRKWERDQVILASCRSETIRGLTSLAAALGERDPPSLAHSRRVAHLCEVVGRRVGMRGARLEGLRLAGLVHDAGKIGIPDEILFATGQLEDHQLAEMKRCIERAAALIRSVPGGDEMARVVEASQENLDGSGYPRGLRGEDIPLEARVLRAADIFASLTEERRYRAPMSTSTALETMRVMAGTKIDARCFHELETAVKQGLVGEGARRQAKHRHREVR